MNPGPGTDDGSEKLSATSSSIHSLQSLQPVSVSQILGFFSCKMGILTMGLL
jgi:hypothetical protein